MYNDHLHRFASMEFQRDSSPGEFAICKSPMCDCPVVDEGIYCSDTCRGTSRTRMNQGGCDCEHSSCGFTRVESRRHAQRGYDRR